MILSKVYFTIYQIKIHQRKKERVFEQFLINPKINQTLSISA